VNKLIIKLLLALSMLSLLACSSVDIKPEDTVQRQPDKVLLAKGYSRVQHKAHLTPVQNQFSVEQAATINAYRELAKLVYSEPLSGGLIVADQVIKHESFRIYLDLFLRDARVVESNIFGGQKKIGLALSLTPRFYQCISTTTARVSECLREDNKVPFTRIGYQQAAVSTVNLSCTDCGSQLSVSGFSTQKNRLDREMLNVGLYDSEWLGNMAVSTMIRYWYLTQIIFN